MSTPSAPSLKKFTVLVIEDDAVIARLIASHLSRHGLEYHHAKDGKSGLAAFQQIKPHLVLLDLMLPGLSGWEVCSQIRAGSTVPIIMLTARGDSEDQVQGFKSGADDYIAKPFDPALLMARVIAHLRRVYRYDAPPRAELEHAAPEEKAGEEHAAPEAGSPSMFSVDGEPYTLADIAVALDIPYKRVQHSHRVLEQRASTQARVQPLDTGRPLHFSAAAARLIARNCRRSKRA